MAIKNIIYVEDGSVDVDSLQEDLGEDTKIIIYRQNSKRPEIEQLATPIETEYDNYFNKLKKEVEEAYHLIKDNFPNCYGPNIGSSPFVGTFTTQAFENISKGLDILENILK